MIKCKNQCPREIFDGCCSECSQYEGCPDACQLKPQNCADAIFEGEALQVFQSKTAKLIQGIANLVRQKAVIEEAESGMREQLKEAMEAHGITKFDNDVIKVTYIAPSTKTSVDSAKLKAQQPDIYEKYSKTSAVKAFVKIEVK